MYYIYVSRSFKNNKRYVGFTAKEPVVKFAEHVSGTNAWTGQNRPLKLIYHENFEDITEARKREKFLKSGQGRELLNRILNK